MIFGIKINVECKVDFHFIKYVREMLELPPMNDISGIKSINILNGYPGKRLDKFVSQNTQAYYSRDSANSLGFINIFFDNIINISIPDYAFFYYPEMGGLLFSEIVFHEIGHHVHFNKRHGVKKKSYEDFANRYAKIGYLKYFQKRSKEILSSYKWASLNFLFFSKEQRKLLKSSRMELKKVSLESLKVDFPKR